MAPVKITIYSDYTCPFCFIGTGIIKALKREFSIEDDWRPYEVHPDAPLKSVPLSEHFPDLNPLEFFTGLDAKGKALGVRFGTQTLLCNSRAALELGELARAEGLHHEYHAAVFRACFTECGDIGNIDVLLAAAGEAGLSREAARRVLADKTYTRTVIESTARGKDLGVRAAPTFFLEGFGSIRGAQPIETFRNALRGLADRGKGFRPLS